MERVYYSINEASARAAHQMMSFRDYEEGSKTREYQGYVNKAYDLADKIAEAKPDEAERAYKLAERYSRRMAENINASSHIGCMCPSVMISGAGNFPVKKKEKQNAAADRNYQQFNEIQGILSKIEAILHGKEIIKSDDERAIEKLEEKLEGLKELQEYMKAANKAVRIKDQKKGDEALRHGVCQVKCVNFLYFYGGQGTRPPFPCKYQLKGSSSASSLSVSDARFI